LNKHRKIFIGFTLLAFSLVFVRANSLASERQQAALLRIEINGDDDLERFADLNIPIMAQLWDEQEGHYLLAVLDSAWQSQLTQLGFPNRVLDPDPQGAAYYLVYTPHPVDVSQISTRGVILESTYRYQLVRWRSEDIRDLLSYQYKMQPLFPYHLEIPSDEAVLQLATDITPDPAIQAMIDTINTTTAYDYVGDLSGEWQITVNGNPYTLSTRYSYDEIPIKKATKFVYEHFTGLGLYTDFDDYVLKGVPLRHVIAEQPGLSNPECIVMLVGHLDSTVWGSSQTSLPSYAPGADDNASGSTGVLMAADALHQHEFACTIRYVLFTGEEQIADWDIDIFQSRDYVQQIYNNDDNVVAVINLDMIGYNSNPQEIIELHTRNGNSGDLAIANLFKDVIQIYDINLTPQIVQDGLSWSDHKSFWDFGYSAILAMEDWEDFTPNYHTTGDRLSTLDTNYLADFIRAAVGTVAHLAGYIPPEPDPLETLFLPLIIKSE
jgi:hypothetical protein